MHNYFMLFIATINYCLWSFICDQSSKHALENKLWDGMWLGASFFCLAIAAIALKDETQALYQIIYPLFF